MSGTLIGYARCSTDEQDLTAQRQRLAELGVTEDRIYLDHGLTGTKRCPMLALSVMTWLGAESSSPKLSPKQQAELRRMHATGDYTVADLTELFSVSRPTVYRTLQRTAS